MAGIIRSLLRSSSNKMSISNSNEINIDNIEQKLRTWKLPKVSTSELYVKPFELLWQTYVIKTVESTHFVKDSNMSFQLFSKYALLKLKRKGFNFIHFGLVQVGVQPLTKNGLNTSIIACIRDRRHNNFKDSLLGLVETTLCNGPIYFNCFPNFSVSLSDPHTVKFLTLDLQTNGCYYEGDIAVVYRIYYKAMDTVAPYCKYSVHHGTTTLFQTNLNTSSIVRVPKSIRWDDVTPPESWILESDQIRESSPESSQAIFTTRDDGSLMVRFIRNSQATSSSLTSSCSSDAKDKGLKSRGTESSSSGIFTQNVYEVETPESAGKTTPQLIQY